MTDLWVRCAFDVSVPVWRAPGGGLMPDRRPVSGWVRDGIGIHRSEVGDWILTHLRSGCMFGSTGTLKRAKEFAAVVLSLAPEFAKRGVFGSARSLRKDDLRAVRRVYNANKRSPRKTDWWRVYQDWEAMQAGRAPEGESNAQGNNP